MKLTSFVQNLNLAHLNKCDVIDDKTLTKLVKKKFNSILQNCDTFFSVYMNVYTVIGILLNPHHPFDG